MIFFWAETPDGWAIPGIHGPLAEDELDAIRWVRQWVDYELLPSDWVAVLSYDVKLKVYQDFTTNKEALQNALTSVAKAKDRAPTIFCPCCR